jgi:hypothetical protein
MFLEGGYDLIALEASMGATLKVALGEKTHDAGSSSGPGKDQVGQIARYLGRF